MLLFLAHGQKAITIFEGFWTLNLSFCLITQYHTNTLHKQLADCFLGTNTKKVIRNDKFLKKGKASWETRKGLAVWSHGVNEA